MTEQPPEMALIERLRLERPKLSVLKAAKLADMSEARWRQLAKGYQQVTAETRVPATAPAETLARMAKAVGATPEQLEAANRPDAASAMRDTRPEVDNESGPEPAYGPQAVARHTLGHTWSAAETFTRELMAVDPPMSLRRAADSLVSIFGLQLADHLIKFDIPIEERDQLLAELYRRRDAVAKQIGAQHDVEASETVNEDEEAASLDEADERDSIRRIDARIAAQRVSIDEPDHRHDHRRGPG